MLSIWREFQPLAAIATTPTGAKKLQALTQAAGATLWVPESCSEIVETLNTTSVEVYHGSLKDHIASLWNTHRGFIFCLATGAAVRLIAPLLQDKSHDPAIVVVDENGNFVISLCSGHQGGADKLARAIALQLNATPILTGASTALGLPGIDVLGVPFGWNRGEGDWNAVSAAVARLEPIEVIQEAGSILWQNHLPEHHPFQFSQLGERENGDEEINNSSNQNSKLHSQKLPKAKIWITAANQHFSSEAEVPKVQWHPRVLWVGIGCERGTSKELIEIAIAQVCQSNNLAISAIAGIATIDIKADEVGLVELCRERNWPLRTFSAEILSSITVPNPSSVVEAEVGTPSVAEAAALNAANCQSLLVAKQIFRSDSESLGIENPKSKIQNLKGAVTVAIAQSQTEYSDRNGKLLLVGTGPGQLDQMTPAAQTAISQADAIIGYSLYIDLISPLLRPGQIVEALPITQERQRAERAIELAKLGLTVAVVSSGDCGIYGMAGLVLEELQTKGWDGKDPGIQVFPGITALQAAASRVGAPLMHDFCAISLSDLLTPWDVIEKRLIGAAQADFVTAIYNPRSQTRTQQIAIAQSIFLKYRDANTPVAIVKSAYRPDEQITLTTLEKMLDIPIDMLTTVLIGNQSTKTHTDWMITPRGYLGFGDKSNS
jgi:cobalt-precorrin 5A hydrolase/precorrin-3B C17-methyltransferase